MVRRDAIVAAGMFRALARAQDLDLWLRVLESGPGVASGVPTVSYHEHPTQASKDGDLMRQAFAFDPGRVLRPAVADPRRTAAQQHPVRVGQPARGPERAAVD